MAAPQSFLRGKQARTHESEAQIQCARDTYLAFRQLKAAVVNDLTRRGGSLANIKTVSTNQSMPASVLAQTLYQDAGRTDQLVQQANPKHPAFMPNDFDALSR